MNAALKGVRARTNDIAIHGVYEVTKLLAASTEPRARLPEVLELLTDFMELSHAAVAFRNGESGLEMIGEQSQTDPPPRMSWLLEQAIERVSTTQMPWIVENESTEPDLNGDGPAEVDAGLDLSCVCVPIKVDGHTKGVLCIERTHSPGDQACFCFDDDVRVLSVVANLIAQSDRADEAGDKTVARPLIEPLEREARTMLGDAPRWRAAIERARSAARSSSTVLLRGESGTGKELLARFIHEASPRHGGPFVAVNCAALSETILESELFGHEKGAYTGAVKQRKGRFELAEGGTLFLDEIGEISAAFQARLLRALQFGEFERVGGTATLKVDVRVVAATNRNLEFDVKSGRFRADLYYRINVVPLFVPPLRNRPSDIPLLAKEFLRRFNRTNRTNVALDESGIASLLQYPFPGNVRELENIIGRAAALATDGRITEKDFDWLDHNTPLTALIQDSPSPTTAPRALATFANSSQLPSVEAGDEADVGARERLIQAMERAGWVQAKAARLLGLTPRQIGYALKKHNILIRKF